MAENVVAKKPLQQGLDDSVIDYYDIMVIGRTGMGKSTTVDKLLIANLAGMQRFPEQQQQQVETQHNLERNTLSHGDMMMWMVSDNEFDIDKITVRLKNLVFFRSLEDPHKEVNMSRESNMHIYESTNHCELFSNESTRIRILDVPGFFGRNAASGTDLGARSLATNTTDLGMMRKVLHIKQAHCLQFNRIVYFLPDKGSLKRTSQNLILEIGIMERYFGRAIFDSMVVVATFPSEVYESLTDNGRNLFSERQFEETRGHLQEAIRQFFPDGGDVPKPPIIFVSLFDTCEDILRKVQSAEVREPRIQLEFNKSVCARCGVTIVEEGKNAEGETKAAHCIYSNQSGAIAHVESTCHPLMLLKYSKLSKFFGGIAHLITFRRFVGEWPNFTSMDEECINCGEAPGTQGCLQIGSKFMAGKEEITVLHSASAAEQRQIEIEEEPLNEDPPPPGSAAPVSPAVSPEGAVLSHGNSHHFVYPDGQHTSVQTRHPLDFDVKGT